MKIVQKKDTLMSKKIVDIWAIFTIIISLAVFFTGKTDVTSFFQNVTVLSYLTTLGRTITAYALTLTVIAFSAFILIDFIILLFGLKFPIAHFLWVYLFNSIVIVWWWQSSLPENIFLSILTLYFLSSYEFETKEKVVSFVYKKTGKINNGFSVGLLLNDMRRNLEGVFIGLIIIRHKKSDLKVLSKTK